MRFRIAGAIGSSCAAGCLLWGFTAITSPAFAANASWDGSTGNWSDGTRWSTDYPPDNDHPDPGENWNAWIFNGEVTLDIDPTVDELTIDGGTLRAMSAHTVTSLTFPMTWGGGNLLGAMTIKANTGIQIAPAAGTTCKIDGPAIHLGGSSVWPAGTGDVLMESGQINVLPGATLDIAPNHALTVGSGPGGTLLNQGTLRTAAFTSASSVVNAGLYELSGPLNVGAGNSFTQIAGGELRLSGAASANGTILGGALTGSGTYSGAVRGRIEPGPGGGAGTLGLIRYATLSLDNSTVLSIDISGVASTDFDRLSRASDVVPADLTLDGNLQLHLASGLENVLTPADTFTIVDNGKLPLGTFDNAAPGARLVTADGRGSFIVNYGASSPFPAGLIVLSAFEPVPEPATGAALLGFLAAPLRRRRRPLLRRPSLGRISIALTTTMD